MAVSPEFRVAVDCCRCCFRDGNGTSVSVPADVDWPRFLELVRFHRVEGLAWNALSDLGDDLPENVRAALLKAAIDIATQNVKAIAECRTLRKRFEGTGAPLLFLKGMTLGALAYRNPALKAAVDIDLLVDGPDLEKSALLLRDCGYRLVEPRESANDRLLYSWHRVSKESTWIKPGLQIDLHTRTADNSRLLTGIGVRSPRQSVEVAPGIDLPTLAPDVLFAYLSVHGASSAWFRLKWLSDFAAIMDSKDPAEIARNYGRSQELGAGRAAGQGLLLADELFGTLNGNADLRDELSRDASTVRLFRAALGMITRAPVEPTARTFGTLPIHWTQLLLLPGLSFKLSELSRQAKTSLKSSLG